MADKRESAKPEEGLSLSEILKVSVSNERVERLKKLTSIDADVNRLRLRREAPRVDALHDLASKGMRRSRSHRYCRSTARARSGKTDDEACHRHAGYPLGCASRYALSDKRGVPVT